MRGPLGFTGERVKSLSVCHCISSFNLWKSKLSVINECVCLHCQGEPGLRGFPGPVGKLGSPVSKCNYLAAVRIRVLLCSLQKGLGKPL